MTSRLIEKKDTGMITTVDYKNAYVKVVYWTFFAIILLLSLMCLLPILWVFSSAFKTPEEFLLVPPTIIPREFDIGKIATVWSKIKIGRNYINSIIYIVGCWAFNIVCNGLGGYVLSKIKPKGHKIMFTVVFWAMLLPTAMNMVPLYLSFTNLPIIHLNLTDTYWPMWIMHGITPFTILLFKSFFDSIPYAYSEAAKIDGCSNIRIFARIIIPLSMPIILVNSITCINGAWSEFMWPMLIIRNPAKFTVAVSVYKLAEELTIDQYFVVLLLSILPPVCVFAIFGRKMMSGISLGGIKE